MEELSRRSVLTCGVLAPFVMSPRRRRTVRRTPLLKAPPVLHKPLIIDYTNAGPYDVTNRVQRADSYDFGETDIVLRMPGARDFGWGTNRRQTAPINRSNGVQLKWSGSLVSVGGEINVATDWVAHQGLHPGSPHFYLSQKNRACLLVNSSCTASVAHIEGWKAYGKHMYEGFNVRGANCDWQFQNIWMPAVRGLDHRKASVRYYPTGLRGTGIDHDGGDPFQTQATEWSSLHFDGILIESAWFQGLFCKNETQGCPGPVTALNVFLRDYQGPGGALYVNGTPDFPEVRIHNFWMEPGFQRAPSDTVGVTKQLPTKTRVERSCYPRGARRDKDRESAYATSEYYLDDFGRPGGIVREGFPHKTVLSGLPGRRYNSPGYL